MAPTTTTLNGPPTVSAISKSCSGSTCTLSVTASDAQGPVTYNWTINGSPYSTSSSFTATAPANDTYNIAVVVTDNTSQTTTRTTTVVCCGSPRSCA